MIKFFKKKPKAKKDDIKQAMPDGNTVAYKWLYFDGKYNYYINEYPSQMHYARYMEIQRAQKLAEFNIDKEWLIKEIDDALNSQRFANLVYLLNEIKARTMLVATEDTALRLTALFVYREDEPRDRFDMEFLKEKERYWRKDAEVYTFFLTFAVNLCEKWANLSPETFLSYLRTTNVTSIMREAAGLS